jgi:large subunit ribosomal protein L31e
MPMPEEIEKIYVIPLKTKGYKSSKAAPTAIKRVRQYLTKHMKVAENDIWIDASLNNAIWSRGKYKMPNKIRVKAVKFEDGVVEAYLPELEFEKSRREILQEEKSKKTPILRKEEIEEEAPEPGEEDIEVVPTADGDVKIKKKKPVKEKEDKPSDKEKKDKKPAEEKPDKPTKKKTEKKEDIKPKEEKKQEVKKEKIEETKEVKPVKKQETTEEKPIKPPIKEIEEKVDKKLKEEKKQEAKKEITTDKKPTVPKEKQKTSDEKPKEPSKKVKDKQEKK